MSLKIRFSSCFSMIEKKRLFGVLALSVLVVFAVFFWQGNKGFNIGDEGFLWYGAQRVMLGEIPIKDFMAYDPGRYYWSAALMAVFGHNGILELRAAVAVFQILGLFTALLLIDRSASNPNFEGVAFLILSASILAIWLFPAVEDSFDSTLSIILVGALTILVQFPSVRGYFVSGFCVGLIAVFGRNHGVYGLAGTFGVFLWLSINPTGEVRFFKGLIIWAVGVAVGYSPVLLMALFVPGFGAEFWESIKFLFEVRATNLPLPVPWPWMVSFTEARFGDVLRGVLLGFFFLSILVFGVGALVWVLLQKLKDRPTQPALVAAAFLVLPYAHYVYSRADWHHLSRGISPLLVACLVFLSTKAFRVKWCLGIALFSSSLWVMHVFYPAWQCQYKIECVEVRISGSKLQVDPHTASVIALISQLVDQYAKNGRNFIATPLWVSAYPLMERRSPMWEIYAIFPRSVKFEVLEIERIKAANPSFAVVFDVPLDGRDELRFQNTHPLIYQYFLHNFELLPESPNPAYKIFKVKGY